MPSRSSIGTVPWHRHGSGCRRAWTSCFSRLPRWPSRVPHPNRESARSMSAAAAAPPCSSWPVASARAVMYSASISPNRCWTSPAGAAEAGHTQATLVRADMSTYAFAPHQCDLAFSRFGVMFFADPVAAFANLRGALKIVGTAGVRLLPVASENAWVRRLPSGEGVCCREPATRSRGPACSPSPIPTRMRRILGEAGFHDISLTRHDPVMQLAGLRRRRAGGRDLSQIGPIARALIGASTLLDSRRDALPRISSC